MISMALVICRIFAGLSLPSIAAATRLTERSAPSKSIRIN